MQVEVNGGEHHIMIRSQGASTGGSAFAESNGTMTFTASGADFYLDGSLGGAIANVRTTKSSKTTATDRMTPITLTDCAIYSTSDSASIIKYANENTYLTLNNCFVKGAITPTVHPADTDSKNGGALFGAMKAGSVVLGAGTRLCNVSYTDGLVVPEDGAILKEESGTETLVFKVAGSAPATDGWSHTETTLTPSYTHKVSAASEYAFCYVQGGETMYTNDLATVFSDADDGSTAVMQKSYTLNGHQAAAGAVESDARLLASRTLTIDMNSKTLTYIQCSQTSIGINTGANLTLMNGTVNTLYPSYSTTPHSYPTFYFFEDNGTLTLNNVDTATGALFYSYGSRGYTVNIEGGEHTVVFHSAGARESWMNAQGECDVNISNAEIFLDSSGKLISTSSNYLTEGESFNFDFTNCKIISDSGDPATTLIRYANSETFLTFTNCDIAIPIAPTVRGGDTNQNPMTEANITFGLGCRISSLPTTGYTVVSGGELRSTSDSETFSFTDYDDKLTSDVYFVSFTTSTTATYAYSIVDPSTIVFSYIDASGNEVTTDNLITAIEGAKADTTITMLMDYTLRSSTLAKDTPMASINKNLTIDLGGYTFSLIQDNQSTFWIYKNLTVKNGEVRTVRSDTLLGGNSYVNMSYPLFYLAGNGQTFSLENVSTYSGSLILAAGDNTTINITGGAHHATNHPNAGNQGAWGGYIESRTNTTFTATDALFFVDKSMTVFGSASRYADDITLKSTFTFNNCQLISDPDESGYDLIAFANSNTYIYFNNCDIDGNINPSVSSLDYQMNSSSNPLFGDIGAGQIVLGVGTRYNGARTMKSGGVIVTADGLALGSVSISDTLAVSDCTDTPYTSGWVFTDREIALSFTMAVVNPSDYSFVYTNTSAVTCYTDDMVEALTGAKAGTTVTFLKDVRIQQADIICSLSRDITVDLGGKVLSVYQEWQTAFYVAANITFMNGEIRTVRSSDIYPEYTVGTTTHNNKNYNNRSYPLFYFTSANKTLNLNNLTVYCGAFVLSTAKGTTINVNGGTHYVTHHDTIGHQGSWGGYIETRADATVNCSDATFIADRSSWIFTSASSYDDMTNPVGSTYTFTGCKLISDHTDNDGTYTLVKYANENTTMIFNSCLIYGSINPTVFNDDYKGRSSANGRWGSIPAEQIILGEGTRIATSILSTSINNLGFAFDKNNLNLIDEAYSETVSVYMCNDKPYTEGYIFTRMNLTLNFTSVVADTTSVTITLHYPDGSVDYLHAEMGDVIADLPTYEIPEAVSNGWVKIAYDGGWSTTGFGTRINSLTVTGRIHLYPSASEARAYLSAAKYNLSLYGNVAINLFIPSGTNLAQGIALEGIYDADGNCIAISDSDIPYGDAENLYMRAELGATSILSLDEDIVTYVRFSYNNVSFEQRITLNAMRYLETVLPNPNTNPDAVALLSDLVIYADAINKYATKSDSATLSVFEREVTVNGAQKTLYQIAEENKSTLVGEDTFTGGELGSFAANDYVYSIAFDLSGSEPCYIVTFKSGTRVTDVKLVMDEAWLNASASYQAGKQVYGINEELSARTDGFLTTAYSTGISIYNLGRNIKLLLTVADEFGGTHTVLLNGDYNLNNYYCGITAGGSFTAADITRAKSVMRALRTYGISSALYRFGSSDIGSVENASLNVYYADFGAVGDGVTDDFGAIYAAHTYANEQKALGRDVTVYAIGNGIEEGATFYICNTDPSAELCGKAAEVLTDTVWDGANFIIDDTGITNDNYVVNDYTTTRLAFNTPIFRVMPDLHINGSYYYKDISYSGTLLQSDTVIKGIADHALPFDTAFVVIENTNHYNYIRFGANATASVQREVVLVDTATGKIDPSTPITTDFREVTRMRVYNAEETPITLSGGDFVVKYNQLDSYHYCQRGITVYRSNTTVEGLTLDYQYTDYNLNNLTGGSPMEWLKTAYTHGVTFRGCEVEGPRRFWDAVVDGKGSINRGSYTFRLDYTSSPAIVDCIQTNFYNDEFDKSYNNTSDGIVDHMGVMGSNYCKNFLFEGNTMTVFDAHSGLYNLVVRGCEVERINVIGSGTVIVEDTLIHTGTTHAAVTLREDYASNFKGDVYFNNVTLETYDEGYVGLFYIVFYNYNTGLYYTDSYQYDSDGDGVADAYDSYYAQDTTKDGDDAHYYSSYLPQNVYVNGLTVLSGGNVSGGVYTKGSEDTSVTLALYNGYTYGESKDTLTKLVHNWDCDISKGDSFYEYNWFTKITYTVNHPIKPTEVIYVDQTTASKYTINDYVYQDKVYNNLEFLDSLTQTTLSEE